MGKRRIQALIFNDLVPSQNKPGGRSLRCVVILDPQYQHSLVLVTPLGVTAYALWCLYRDCWPIEQIPLCARQMLGAVRSFVFASKSRVRLPVVSLLAGSLLSYCRLVVKRLEKHDKEMRMFGSGVLELAIGMIFVYLILSLICTGVNEWIASQFNVRGKNLFDGITNLLNDPDLTGLAQLMYGHGLVDGISQDAANPNKSNRLPSYMSSGIFALALMDILKAIGNKPDAFPQFAARASEAGNNANPPDATRKPSAVKPPYDRWGRIDTALLDAKKLETALQEGRDLVLQGDMKAEQALDNIRIAVKRLPAGHTKESLFVLIDKTKRDANLLKKDTVKAEDYLEQFQKNLEQWYDEAMMRVGGWYKRWTQRILLLFGFVLVFAVNADSIMLMKSLSRNDALRGSLVAAADEVATTPPVSAPPQPQPSAQPPASLNEDPRYSKVLEKAGKLDLPLGWTRSEDDPLKTYHVPHLADVDGSWLNFLGLCLMKLVGLLISAVAVSLGAPFWFDTLSKVVNLRGAGTPPGGAKKSEPKPTEKTP